MMMRLIAVVCAIVLALSTCGHSMLATREGALNIGLRVRGHDLLSARDGGLKAQYFSDQLVDHFDPTSRDTWSQKYYVNSTSYKEGGPVFLVIGGEGPLSDRYVSDAFITGEWAAKMGAMVVAVEHRYYGESYPVKDVNTESLKFLTSEQALADLARFQVQVLQNALHVDPTKVILFGGSYSGALAAWGRLKYPHLFRGAFASSGPVWAKWIYTEFLEVVEMNLPSKCAKALRGAYAFADELSSNQTGFDKLQSMFTITGDAGKAKEVMDVAIFMESITDPVAEIIQYNHDHPNTMDIAEMCSYFQGTSSNEADAFAALAQFFSDRKAEVYANMAQYAKDLQTPGAMRSWTYQTCAEFSYFQPSTPHGVWSSKVTMDLFVTICNEAFGENIFLPFSGTNETNANYGSTDLKWIASNTYFGDGTVDPWHALAVLPDNYKVTEQKLLFNSGTVLINGTAHCADLYGSRNSDLPGLTSARGFAANLLLRWLQPDAREEL